MHHLLLRAVLSVGVSLAVGGTALPSSTSPAGATSHVCFEPTAVGAAARGVTNPRIGDHRAVTPADQRRIDDRTNRVLRSRKNLEVGTVVTIPLYVHVMTSTTGAGNVSDARITRQVAVLNQTYSGQDADHPGGVDTGFRFALAGVDRFRNDAWHRDGQSTTYRARTRQGGRNALNVWLVDFDYLGVATFPWDDAKSAGVDGVRVQFSSVPGGGAKHYNHGKTATHEVGHWLGLFHTFQGGCAGPGDEVSDTPAQASPSTGCPTGRDSCSAPGLDPIHNYLDYSYDDCYRTFTPGQIARMKRMWTAYRA